MEATVLKILFYIATADFLQISFTTSATSQNFLHHLQRDFPSIELMNVIAFYSSQVLTWKIKKKQAVKITGKMVLPNSKRTHAQ